MPTITPNLWFDTQAEQAAEFYVSILPNSKITEVSYYNEAGPGEAGTVMAVVSPGWGQGAGRGVVQVAPPLQRDPGSMLLGVLGLSDTLGILRGWTPSTFFSTACAGNAKRN